MQEYIDVLNGINWQSFIVVNKVLTTNRDIDTLYDEGVFFKMAIRNKSYDILKALIGYFEENQLSKYKEGSPDYLVLRSKVQEIVTDAVDETDLAPELHELLKPYLLNQFSTTDSLDNNIEKSTDPMDTFDPKEYFANSITQTSTPEQAGTPEKSVEPMGEHNLSTEEF